VLDAVTDDDVSNETFPFATGRTVRIVGAKAWAQRITYVGELGWELFIDPSWAVQIWDRLWAAGVEHGVRAVGYRALDGLRMEKGYRYFGTDLTPLETPFQTGLGAFVAIGKGGFEGRKALVDATARPPDRMLRTLLVGRDDYLTVYGGEAIVNDGQALGRIRSCAYGYTVGRNIAYALLPASSQVGDRLHVEVFGERIPAEVAPDILYDPERRRPRA
jgi:dimethylglycine oxidase